MRKLYFRCLADWKIEYPSKKETEYRNQCSKGNKKAAIYPWESKKRKQPSTYIFHEQLHLALHELALRPSRETEENIIQDVETYIRRRK